MLSPSFLYMAESVYQRMLSLSTVQTTHTLFAQKHNKETKLKDISPACRFPPGIFRDEWGIMSNTVATTVATAVAVLDQF